MPTDKLQILTPIVTSVNGETGDVTVATKTSELTNDSGFATTTYVDTSVAGLVDSAPETLDTLNELSAALGNDPNFATTVANQIGTKVDKVNGKGLSTNDYTTAEKNKLSGIATGANKTTVDSALSSTSTNPVQNKVINTALSGKANSSHTHKASDITSGVIPLDRGGTGSSVSLRDAPNGAIIRKISDDKDNQLYYTSTKSGAFYSTGANVPADFGTLPIAQGGTGATKAADARNNLGITPANIGAAPSSHTHSYLPLSAGTLTGNLTISKDNNPWLRLQQGDANAYVQVSTSGSAEKLSMGFGSTKSLSVDSDGCLMLTSAMYGTTLPAAGKKGRIFFKKV